MQSVSTSKNSRFRQTRIILYHFSINFGSSAQTDKKYENFNYIFGHENRISEKLGRSVFFYVKYPRGYEICFVCECSADEISWNFLSSWDFIGGTFTNKTNLVTSGLPLFTIFEIAKIQSNLGLTKSNFLLILNFYDFHFIYKLLWKVHVSKKLCDISINFYGYNYQTTLKLLSK